MDTKELIAATALAAAKHNAEANPEAELAALLHHGQEARRHVWDRHYANPSERDRLDEKLVASPPAFQAAVAATERVLADELGDDNQRRARVRAENPHYFQD